MQLAQSRKLFAAAALKPTSKGKTTLHPFGVALFGMVSLATGIISSLLENAWHKKLLPPLLALSKPEKMDS